MTGGGEKALIYFQVVCIAMLFKVVAIERKFLKCDKEN